MYFPFPLLMSIHPGNWRESCIDSVTIFMDQVRKTERQRETDKKTDRERAVVCTINCSKQKQRFFKQTPTPLWYILHIHERKLFFLSQLFAGGAVGLLGLFVSCDIRGVFFFSFWMPATQNSPARVNMNTNTDMHNRKNAWTSPQASTLQGALWWCDVCHLVFFHTCTYASIYSTCCVCVCVCAYSAEGIDENR